MDTEGFLIARVPACLLRCVLLDVRAGKRKQATTKKKKSLTEILCHGVCVVHVVQLGRSFSVCKNLEKKKRSEA